MSRAGRDLQPRPTPGIRSSVACSMRVFGLVMFASGCGGAVDVDPGGSTSDAASSSGSEASSGTAPIAGASSSSSSTSAGDVTTLAPDETTSTTDDGSSSTGGTRPADPGCPECTVLVDALVGGRGIAVDESYVYFTDQSQGTVHRIMKGGGDGGVIVDGQDSPYDITVDATHVYWTNFAADGAVMRAPKDGGRAEVIAMVTRPRPVAVDATHVYWGSFETGDGQVQRRDLELAEPPELLADLFGGVSELVLGDGRVYWTCHSQDAGGSFIPDPNEEGIGAVFLAVLDGTADPFASTLHAGDQAQPWGIARTPDGQLLWANGDGASPNFPNSIMSLSEGSQASVVYEDSAAPWGVAADETHVYWTDNERVFALPLEGEDAVQLAELQNGARSITVDEDDVFWVTRERVLQRPKP